MGAWEEEGTGVGFQVEAGWVAVDPQYIPGTKAEELNCIGE